jgi:hypothetical protein
MTRLAPTTVRRGNPPDADERAVASTPRRRLQLALAGLWVLDGLLKLQPFMFTKSFAPMTLGDAAEGAPGWLAGPIHWASGLLQQHPVGLMLLFALIELAIGFGIAWPRTVRPALLACMLWVPFLWFFAEGLGGLASGTASPFDGAPGASILYGLLAVLLWPAAQSGPGRRGFGRSEPGEAGRFVGGRSAQVIWVVLWGLLAFLALRPANTAPDAFSDAISDNATGVPTGYASLLGHAASWTAGHGQALGVALGALLALVAVSVLAPWARVVRAGMVLAIVLAALVWVFGEGFGMPFMGMGTDPDTGPLLALLALAYWPARRLAAVTSAVPPDSPGFPNAPQSREGATS